jgi:hypothetical protein
MVVSKIEIVIGVALMCHSFLFTCCILGAPQKCPKSAKCGEDWHVCNKHEQRSGALQAARANGMFSGEIGKGIERWIHFFVYN